MRYASGLPIPVPIAQNKLSALLFRPPGHHEFLVRRELASQADQPIVAPIMDLKESGPLGEAFVLVGGEFELSHSVESSGCIGVQKRPQP